MVPTSEIITMAAVAVLSVLLPFIFMLVLSRKFKISWVSIILGVAVFFVFTLILEQILHVTVLQPGPDGSIELLINSP